MAPIKQIIQDLFNAKGINISSARQALFDDFVKTSECEQAVHSIIEKENQIMEQWEIKNRIADIVAQQIVIPNAKVGLYYEAKIDFKKLSPTDFRFKHLEGLEQIGLNFDTVSNTIEGIPIQSGDFKIKLLFRIEGESETTLLNEKLISLVVNPDPKSLWKDIPSDRNDIFWKEDDVSTAKILGDKNIVVSSKRGRSHKNVGSFRDDDFAFQHFKSGWSVIAISDGAGSYSLSRKGSQLACKSVIEYFGNHSDIDKSNEFESKILEYSSTKDAQLLKEIEVLAKRNLYKATLFVYNKIKDHSEETFKTNPELFNNPKAKSCLEYYHSTLIFALIKKYQFGYVVLTFGVGDCPIAMMNEKQTETTLLNWLDVGEFGGGTRFITQTEIFHSAKNPFETRFNFKIVPDFSFLFLMTDGIYDPKFVVEANLEKNEKWTEFLQDLQGMNDENVKVDFSKSNTEIASQLSNWMDFWSQGNHDDRTLAIVY